MLEKNIKIVAITLFFVLVLLCLNFAQETLTITTYYPSPNGNYRELGAFRMKVGDTYSNFVLDNADNDRLLVEGRVGIGTTAPAAELDVAGRIVGGFGARTTGGTLDWNDLTNTLPGSGTTLLRVATAANTPPFGNYFHPFNFEYNSKNGSGSITQLAIPYSDTTSINGGIFMRGRYTGVWSSWVHIISAHTNGNVGIGTGTAAPAAILHISGTDPVLLIRPQTMDVEDVSRIRFADPDGGTGPMEICYKDDGTPDLAIMGGRVGIGTTNPQGALHVVGAIWQGAATIHPDYVFEPEYKLESIEEHAKFMWENKHLKAVPKAIKDGTGRDTFEIGAQTNGILEELEKAHLYIQQLNERIKALEAKVGQ